MSYSALFADDLKSIFIFKKPGHIIKIINKYLESLSSWLFQWRLKMNAKECCYTIFSNGVRNGMCILMCFFTVACVSDNSLDLVQRIQNRAIRCIYRLDWDSPTNDLFSISGVLFVKERLIQLGARYTTKAIHNKNVFLCPLISEYTRSWSAITARGKKMSTPLCFFTSLLSISFACIVFIVLSVFCYFIFFKY